MGLNYSEWDRAVNLPLGATVELGRGVSIRPMFDGDRGHLMLNYFTEQYGVSLMYVWFERLGLSCAVGFYSRRTRNAIRVLVGCNASLVVPGAALGRGWTGTGQSPLPGLRFKRGN
jgi:hypothetical protein